MEKAIQEGCVETAEFLKSLIKTKYLIREINSISDTIFFYGFCKKKVLRCWSKKIIMSQEEFFQAIEDNDSETVEQLISDLTVSDLRADNNFALRQAVENGHSEVVKVLVKGGLTI